MATPQYLRQRFNLDVRVGNEAMAIDRAGKTVEVLDHSDGRKYRLPYDKLILAPGATPIIPAIDHVHAANVFTLRNMEDTRAMQAYLTEEQPKCAVIAGGGFIGLEMAEALRNRGLVVTLIEKNTHVLPPLDREMAVALEDELRKNGVNVITGSGVHRLIASPSPQPSPGVPGEGVMPLVGAVETDDGRRFDADLVLLSIGVRPARLWLRRRD